MNKEQPAIAISFGIRMKKMRQANGLSQETFAALCGLDRSYIGGVERGERNVSLINISKIAKALNINIDELFRDVHG